MRRPLVVEHSRHHAATGVKKPAVARHVDDDPRLHPRLAGEDIRVAGAEKQHADIGRGTQPGRGQDRYEQH